MLKTYHHLTTCEFALSLPFSPVGVGDAQTSLDSLRKEDVTSVCAACKGKHMVRWKAGAQPPKEYFAGAVQTVSHHCQSSTCLRAVWLRPFTHSPFHQPSSLPLHGGWRALALQGWPPSAVWRWYQIVLLLLSLTAVVPCSSACFPANSSLTCCQH